MNRTSIINDIINQRHSRQEEIAKRLNTVSSLISGLEDLKERSAAIQVQLHDDFKTSNQLRTVDDKISEATEQIEKLRSELRRLKTRTQRDTLNIGIVGVPKQGKSTFLQAMTGLDEATIPTGNDYVTGACSYLRHDPEVQPGDAYAIITPYTRKEFLDEVLRPFCRCFGLGLDSAEDLPYLTLPDKDGLKESDKRILERLEELKNTYHSYKSLLGQEARKISKDEIRLYVAQCDEHCKDKYTNWYAVKKAEIHCRFPQEDIGRIMICDTPGLGDFTPGAQQALMDKLSADMDVVFFMKRLLPGDQTISERDTAFHDVVKDANSLIEVSDWAYMILNCSDGDSPSDVFLNNLRSKLPTRMGALQLNAKNQNSVSDCFNKILHDIVGQIPKIDQKLISSYSTAVDDVKKTIAELIASAKKVKLANATSGERLNDSLIRPLLDNLFEQLEAFKRELSEKGVSSIAPEIENIISRMRQSPPKFEYTAREASQPGKYYFKGKNIMRARFIAEFSQLDSTMESMIKSVQNRLMNILTAPEGGRLGFIADGSDESAFWDNLRETITETLSEEDSRHLIQAIDNVTGIKMNFRAFILPRLTEITNGLSNAPITDDSPFANFAFNQKDQINVCINKLNSAWQCAVGRSEELFDEEEGDMKDINTTPAASMIALIDEFELLWMHYNGDDEAESILKAFYEKHQNEVWPEKFESDASIIKIAKQWNKAITSFVDTTKQLF